MRFASVLVCLTATASAQPAPTLTSGPTLLAHVQQYYAKVTDYKAAVRYVHTAWPLSTTQDGHLWVQRPSSYRFDVYKKVRKRLVVRRTILEDGSGEWTIDHEGKWYRQRGTQPSPLAIAVQFVLGGWTYQSLAVVTVGKDLELTLNAPTGAGFRSLTLLVDVSGRVKGSTVVDDVGEIHQFMFFSPDTNPAKPPSATMFQFSPSSAKNYTKQP